LLIFNVLVCGRTSYNTDALRMIYIYRPLLLYMYVNSAVFLGNTSVIVQKFICIFINH